MSQICVFRVTARWLSLLMLLGILCPRVARAAETPATGESPAKAGIVVLDTTGNSVVVSAGERDGVTIGTELRILRGATELGRVRVVETSFATSRAKMISGVSAGQVRVNDQAEVVGSPAPRARSGPRFPWLTLVGAGILALVVVGAVHEKGEGAAGTTGVADVKIN